MNKILLIFSFLALSTASYSMKYNDQEVIDTLKIGDICPDYAFIDTAGVKQSLKSLRGKYVFIDVWATWCSPCRQQFPYLKEFEEIFKSEDIVFLGVNVDFQDFRWKGDVQNLKPAGLQWMVKDRKMFKDQFDMKYLPRCIMLDKEGRILRYKMSLPSKPETKEYIKHLLGL